MFIKVPAVCVMNSTIGRKRKGPDTSVSGSESIVSKRPATTSSTSRDPLKGGAPVNPLSEQLVMKRVDSKSSGSVLLARKKHR